MCGEIKSGTDSARNKSHEPKTQSHKNPVVGPGNKSHEPETKSHEEKDNDHSLRSAAFGRFVAAYSNCYHDSISSDAARKVFNKFYDEIKGDEEVLGGMYAEAAKYAATNKNKEQIEGGRYIKKPRNWLSEWISAWNNNSADSNNPIPAKNNFICENCNTLFSDWVGCCSTCSKYNTIQTIRGVAVEANIASQRQYEKMMGVMK